MARFVCFIQHLSRRLMNPESHLKKTKVSLVQPWLGANSIRMISEPSTRKARMIDMTLEEFRAKLTEHERLQKANWKRPFKEHPAQLWPGGEVKRVVPIEEGELVAKMIGSNTIGAPGKSCSGCSLKCRFQFAF